MYYDPLERRVAWLEQNNADLQQQVKNLQRKLEQTGGYPQQHSDTQSSQIDSNWINGWINNLDFRLKNIESSTQYLQDFPKFQARIEDLESKANSSHARLSKLKTTNLSSNSQTSAIKPFDIEKLLKTFQALQEKVEQLTKENQEIQENVEQLKRINSKLNDRLKQLEQNSGSSRSSIQSSIVQPAQESQPINLSSSRQKFVPTEYETHTETSRATNTTNSRSRANQNSSIVAKYNRLIGLSGVEFKRARDDFRSEYDVKAFKCGNVDARMNNPSIQPNFVDDSINGNGNYWAVPSDVASFYVFPNVRVYNDNLHNERAMGIVFDSNFQGGKTYEKVSVESPAKFSRNGNNWILEHKGRLVLE